MAGNHGLDRAPGRQFPFGHHHQCRANGGPEPNDLNVAGIFHKLGYRGAPITQLSMGEQNDCRGWLVGEPHKGLSYMFQMMNETRIDVGLSAAAISSAGLLRLPGICPGKDPGTQARR